jgi:putative sigma-54 modulation protein
MQLEITGHHIEVTSALSTYINEKFDRIKRHFDQVLDIHVILKVENKTQHMAEASMHVSGNQIFANAKEGHMYAAIDALVDKLDRQVLKHKAKLKDHHRDESAKLNSQMAAEAAELDQPI